VLKKWATKSFGIEDYPAASCRESSPKGILVDLSFARYCVSDSSFSLCAPILTLPLMDIKSLFFVKRKQFQAGRYHEVFNAASS
jgi:hypothetical protein